MGRKIDKLEKPVGVDYIWGGQKEKKQGLELWESLIGGHYIGLPCNGILIRQFSHPFVLFAIPLSFIGALLALALTNNTLNIFTILGVIMLMVSSVNAIMLVDYTNQRRAAGNRSNCANSSQSCTTTPNLSDDNCYGFGMFPIALASGAGAEWKNGLAWVLWWINKFIIPNLDYCSGDL
jgi:HAE1 family hydrophobic/amphiphilic exporter-1